MLTLTVLGLLLGTASAQVPQPSPSPAPPNPLPRIGVSSELVQLDVVITDGKGRPVTGLTAESFEVLEDGQPRPITHFVPGVAAGPRPPAVSPLSPSRLPADTRDAEARAPRYLVLAVDDYHLEPAELPDVQKALRHFIDRQLVAGDEAMVVAASGSLGALQQFTADRTVLHNAVDRIRPQNRSHRPGPFDVPRITEYQAELIEQGDREALSMAVEEIMADSPGRQRSSSMQSLHERRVQTLARQIVGLTAHVTSLTLSALERLVEGLRPVRGRKVVAFFSSGFFLGPERQSQRRELQVIADAAARSGVVFYTIDARGLTSTAPIADARFGGGSNIRGARSAGSAATPGTRARIELRGVDAARDGLNALALDTGGLAFFDRNDMSAPLERMLEDSAVYYRLGFEPQDAPRDGRFHKVQVRVPGQPGLRVRAPTGYFARALGAAETAPAALHEEASRLLRTALESTQPSRGVPVELAAEYLATEAGDVVLTTAWIDLSAVPFSRAGERFAAALDLVGMVVDEAGKAVDQFSDRVELNLTADSKERAVRNGLTYRRTLAVPPGLLQARVAVRADGTEQVGSGADWVEVPERKDRVLALSSILVLGEGEAPAAPPSGGHGTVTFDRPRQGEVARRLPRTGHLDYALLAYGSGKRGATPPAEVLVESQLLSGSTVLTHTTPAPARAEHPGGPPVVSGRLRLEPLAPGDYELRLVVRDPAGVEGSRSLRFKVE